MDLLTWHQNCSIPSTSNLLVQCMLDPESVSHARRKATSTTRKRAGVNFLGLMGALMRGSGQKASSILSGKEEGRLCVCVYPGIYCFIII